jgi:UDP-glucose 4-epimerase
MRVWITGIAGFLGGHLNEALAAQGHRVMGNDNYLCASVTNGVVSRIDCCDFNNMKFAFEHFKVDVLYHCAATAHEGLSNFSPSFITRNIYEASVATFSAAIAAGVKRIVFMSSMARYGAGTFGDEWEFSAYGPPFREDQQPNPIDPYGIAKVAAEKTLKSLCKLHGVEYVIAVPHNIIGPRQRYVDPYRNVASIMINRALQAKTVIVYGDGKQTRCFSPIKDCLDSLVKMVDAPIAGETINIGPDNGEVTVEELARMIIGITNTEAGIEFVPARPNEVKEAFCSSDKARRLLGYEPKQPLRSCLEEMVDYIRLHGTKPFVYDFPIEIEKGCPATWLKKQI